MIDIILRVKQGFDYSKIIASEEVVTQKKNEEAPKGALTLGLDEGGAEKKSRRVRRCNECKLSSVLMKLVIRIKIK